MCQYNTMLYIMDKLLYKFCGNETFLDYSLLYQETPRLTECFQDTFPVWLSCGYLWLLSLPFTMFLLRSKRPALQYSFIHILKMAMCLALACLTQLHFSFRQMYGNTCMGNQVQPDSAQTATWIKFATFVLAAGLVQSQKNCGVKTSGVPFAFWCLVLVADTFRLYSYSFETVVCGTQVVFYVYYGLVLIQIFLHCWAERDYVHSTKSECPMDEASVVNRIFYHWFTSTVYTIYRKRFSKDTMWAQTEALKSDTVGPPLQNYWQTRLKTYFRSSVRKSSVGKKSAIEEFSTSSSESTPLLRAGENTSSKIEDSNNKKLNRPSLLRAVLRTYTWDLCEFFAYGILAFWLYFPTPLLLRTLIEYIEAKNNSTAGPAWMGVAYVVALCLLLGVNCLVFNTAIHHSAPFGLKVKSALIYMIYKKALSIAKTKHTMSVGEVVSLLSVDCQRIQDATPYCHFLVLILVGVAAFTWQVVKTVGVFPTISGLVVLFAVTLINIYIAYKQHNIQGQILKLKGLRVRLINEVLSGIKVLKMYAWEPAFIRKIEDIRTKESKLLRKNAILLAMSTTVVGNAHYLVHFALITGYVVLSVDHFISSSVMFVALSLVLLIKYIVTWLPVVISGAVQVSARF